MDTTEHSCSHDARAKRAEIGDAVPSTFGLNHRMIRYVAERECQALWNGCQKAKPLTY